MPKHYNATFFTNTPESFWARHDGETLQMVYEAELWRSEEAKRQLPDRQRVRAVCNRIRTKVAVMNVEHWSGPDARRKHIDLLAMMKAERPDVKFGVYGICETASYDNVACSWYRDRLVGEEQQLVDMTFSRPKPDPSNEPPVADGPLAKSDIVCPSITTDGFDADQTYRYAAYVLRRWMIAGRPVVPFLSVSLIANDAAVELAKAKIRACRELGITPCWWGGHRNPDPTIVHPVKGPFDESAPWIKALD